MMLKNTMYSVLASMSSDPLDYISGSKSLESVDVNGITSDASVLGIGASYINLVTVLGIIGIICSLIICGIKILIFHNDPREMTENKKTLITKCMIAVAISAFVTLAGVGFGIIQQMTQGVN